MIDLTYAKIGGPHDDWFHIEVIDLETGLGVFGVREVHTAEGWLIRAVTQDGKPVLDATGDAVATERVEGRFEICRAPRAMSVRDLVAALQALPQDLPVVLMDYRGDPTAINACSIRTATGPEGIFKDDGTPGCVSVVLVD